MKSLKSLLLLIMAVIIPVVAFSSDEIEHEKNAIKKVIENAYVKGVHINQDVAAMRKGFHPDFTMLRLSEDNIKKITLDEWIEKIEQSKRENPDQKQPKVTSNIEVLNVTGNAAVAKIELYKDAKHIYTDFMSLYKFSDGWKIVNKIYFKHK